MFEIGEQIGPYEIVEKLGLGGMATVFRAHHAALGRDVALKILHPSVARNDAFLRRFQREARVVAQLEHAHIVPVYDFSEHDGHPFLVMRLVEGETLKDRLSRSRLTKAQMGTVVRAVAAGLDYAHKRGILHRDVKPSNILLGPTGDVWITDFGLARLIEAGESTLSFDMTLGTPHYISPEQARGDRQLDRRTDIYALGVIIFELICGHVPFEGDSPYKIIQEHITATPPTPSSSNRRVSSDLDELVAKALCKEPQERFRSAGELAEAFVDALVRLPGELYSQLDQDLRVAARTAETVTDSREIESPYLQVASGQSRRRMLLFFAVGMLLGMCLCAFTLFALDRLQQTEEPATPVAWQDGSPSARGYLQGAGASSSTSPSAFLTPAHFVELPAPLYAATLFQRLFNVGSNGPAAQSGSHI